MRHSGPHDNSSDDTGCPDFPSECECDQEFAGQVPAITPPIAAEARLTFLMHKANACANLECPNKAVEGVILLSRNRTLVGGHRGITLFLCSPCAHAFTGEKDLFRPAGPATMTGLEMVRRYGEDPEGRVDGNGNVRK